jgi:hypothetical protein
VCPAAPNQALALTGRQRSRRSAVPECCQPVWGVAISQGAIPRAGARGSDALAPHEAARAEQARRARLHDLAETGGSQHGGVAWRWVLVNPTVAWFTVQASRSHAAFEALVASWAELVVRDG